MNIILLLAQFQIILIKTYYIFKFCRVKLWYYIDNLINILLTYFSYLFIIVSLILCSGVEQHLKFPVLTKFGEIFRSFNIDIHPSLGYLGFIVLQLAHFLLIYTYRNIDITCFNNKLLTVGAYSIVRYPIYLCVIIYAIGFSMMTMNYFVILGWVILISILIDKIGEEENRKRAIYKDMHRDYCEKVRSKIIPFIY